MSMMLMTQAMAAKVGNATRKLVLIKLADNANDKGICWPSLGTIAHLCETSRKTVQRHLKQLEADNFIKVKHRRKGNEPTSSLYFLLAANWPPMPLRNKDDENEAMGIVELDKMTPPPQGQNDPTPPGDKMTLPQGHDVPTLGSQCPYRRDTVTPKPVIEPVIEPIIEPEREAHADLLGDEAALTDWQSKEKKGQAFSMPSDWKPKPETLEYGKQLGISDEHLPHIVEHFMDHFGGKTTKRVGWDSSLKTWLRKEAPTMKPRGPSNEASKRNSNQGWEPGWMDKARQTVG